MNLIRLASALVFAVTAFAFSTGFSLAQQKSLKEALIGPWLITAANDVRENGQKTETWGGPVHGQITLGRTGRFSQIIVGPQVASMKQDDPRKPDALVVAYYGTYTVDEASKKVTLKVEGASYSARVGQPSGWTVQGSGDTLTFVGSARKDQHGTFTPHLEVKRP